MCGIVGAVADKNVVPFLLQGLKQLEYRGYDSSGIAVIGSGGEFARTRKVGKVGELEQALGRSEIAGTTGIAHTRWATHGRVTEKNAHPHICWDKVAVVCNGIVENYEELRQEQKEFGFDFTSETDTEVIVHQIYRYLEQGKELVDAVRATTQRLDGAYALGVVSVDYPDRLIAARNGPPLLVGASDGQVFIASDTSALVSATNQFYVLENGDVADVSREGIRILGADGQRVERPLRRTSLAADGVTLGDYRHYMQKEIFEQPNAVTETLESRISSERVLEETFGPEAQDIFDSTDGVQIVACGTSYHAGLVAKYWYEHVGIPCNVEIASEYRYRRHAARPHSLLVTLSQSGETADTLAALEYARELGFEHTLTICNTPESSLVRASELAFMMHAGPEIGVASTKAFTTQLVALLLLGLVLWRRRKNYDPRFEAKVIRQLRSLPGKIEQTLKLDKQIQAVAELFADKQHALFLGRGAQYPIALEGALKLKEISYIHAEAYPAGELKHGPLALVDSAMPVVAVAPNNQLLEKLKSNIQEVRARGGRMVVFADVNSGFREDSETSVIDVAPVDDSISPILYTIPLQLLAYHVAIIKGTDVDKPRNLAKSVTVE
ncbi:MAG: glutamine--fructose-6-phosphate transaminase (isomerizing) [Arenicellales bacterium]|nr:glutamine--fructose-6-phosphate transaminase (isomerizing) [Arenicellales bacterium]